MTLNSLTTAWNICIRRHALWIVIAVLALSAAGLYYSSGHLAINTDTADMLSPELPWRQSNIREAKAFPQYQDTIVIVIDAPTEDGAQDASLRIGQQLQQRPALFSGVFLGQDAPFFRREGLLFMDIDELQDLSDKLSIMQPFLARLAARPTLAGLFDTLGLALDEVDKGDAPPLGPALDRIAGSLVDADQGRPGHLSWQALITDKDADAEARRRIITVKPVLDFGRLLPGKPAVEAIRTLVARMGLERQGIRVRLTGGVTLAYEELQSVSRGAGLAGLLSLLAVTLVLIIGLRSFWTLLASLVTLLVGLSLTASFAALAIGELNMISVAFAVLYIGLGVDFAIHYCLKYQEDLQWLAQDQALLASGHSMVGSLSLCALTTAVGFYAFVPTDYSGVAELGIISGTGIFISLILSLTLLPALLHLLPEPVALRPARTRESRHLQYLLHVLLALPQTRPRTIIIVSTLLAVVSLALLPKARFDPNPLNLQDPTTESVQTYRELLAESDGAAWSIVSLAHSRAQARALRQRLEGLPSVDRVLSVDSFIASDQADKLDIIEEMGLILGDIPAFSPPATRPDPAREIDSMQRLARKLDAFLATHPDDPLAPAVAHLRQALDKGLQTRPDATRLAALRERLLGTLPGRLDRLRESLEAEPYSLKTLPEAIRARWVSPQGLYRLEVYPRGNLADPDVLRRFVADVRTVDPAATDSPVVFLEAARAVVHAFQQAFSYALVITILILFLLLRPRRDSLLVLTPLLLGGLLTAAASVVLDIPFNFANIIALPLLLGIGVDSGVHMVHRYRGGLEPGHSLLATSTARGVLFSALTTICSFGNLAFSHHQGTASMGIMLTLGLMFTLLSTLFLLPALLQLSSRKTVK